MAFKMDDYVDVAERIQQFYAKYPDGRLTCGAPPEVRNIGGKDFIWYHAQAWRTPDDPCPADGWAAEPVPGPTQFTRDSELQNAETAAWGRAIVALGFATKHIASANEVRNRAGTTEPKRAAAEKTTKQEGGGSPPPVTLFLEEQYTALGLQLGHPRDALEEACRNHRGDEEWFKVAVAKAKRALEKKPESYADKIPPKAKVA